MARAESVLGQQGWKKIRDLGEGGQAKVFLVQKADGSDPTQYALKFLRSEQGTQAYERFHTEIEALKKVQHQSVVAIHSHGSDPPRTSTST